MKLGAHVSTAGGISNAVTRADELGCNTFQIFVSNPRGWRPTIISDEEASKFRELYLAKKMEEAVAHSIYLINLASSNPFFLEQSINSLANDLDKSGKLGLAGLVTHIGSHKGESLETGIKRVSESIQKIFLKEPESCLLLENTAGQGSLVGDRFNEIGEIIRQVSSPKIGFCLDTAHAFESGYEIQTEKGLNSLVEEIDKEIGLERLKAIHLNDSLTKLGSHHDRHAEFGEGEIGEEAMIRIINNPSLSGKPFIMETPKLKTGEAGREFLNNIRSYSK